MTQVIHFAIPGDLQTLTGGYVYDRRLIAGLELLGLRVIPLHLSNRFPLPDAAALAEAEAAFAALPDGTVVLADGLAWGVMDEIAERHAGRLRIIALCHHPLALESGLSQARSQQLLYSEKRALDAAAAVLVTSQSTAQVLTEQFSIPSVKVTVAPPGTDQQAFSAGTGHPPVLLSVATLTPRKAHDVLIDALAQIRHLRWVARFVGGSGFDPAWAAQLRDQVKACDLSDRISFVGELANLHDEYRNADVFVLPSRFEGYGMVFAEALSFGLPIIAARAGAVPDVVPDTAGLLVPPGDAGALAAALTLILADNVLRKRLQLGAQQAAPNLPGWNDTAAVVAKLIREVSREPDRALEGFPVAWLDLRESADFAARDKTLVARALQWLESGQDQKPLIVDLGSGTGSTLRALSALGATDLVWRLVDHDMRLLREALRRHGTSQRVDIHKADLLDVASLPLVGARLVSASALFDLVSREVVDQLAANVVQQNSGFYAALNYDGRTEWQPVHPYDTEVLNAFNKDQRRDKGLGPALGPESGKCLQAAFEKRGYVVQVAVSPWTLGSADQALVKELIAGIAAAVSKNYGLDLKTLQQWKTFRLANSANGTCVIGHQDILALPYP